MSEKPTTQEELLRRAEALQSTVNAAVEGVPPMAQRAALDAAAERLCGSQWRWVVVESMGSPPQVLITEYRGRL